MTDWQISLDDDEIILGGINGDGTVVAHSYNKDKITGVYWMNQCDRCHRRGKFQVNITWVNPHMLCLLCVELELNKRKQEKQNE